MTHWHVFSQWLLIPRFSRQSFESGHPTTCISSFESPRELTCSCCYGTIVTFEGGQDYCTISPSKYRGGEGKDAPQAKSLYKEMPQSHGVLGWLYSRIKSFKNFMGMCMQISAFRFVFRGNSFTRKIKTNGQLVTNPGLDICTV